MAVGLVVISLLRGNRLEVRVKNGTGGALHMVTLRFAGGERRFDPLNIGQTAVLAITPSSPSEIRLEFETSSGERVNEPVPGSYVEPHYSGCIDVLVQEGNKIRADSRGLKASP